MLFRNIFLFAVLCTALVGGLVNTVRAARFEPESTGNSTLVVTNTNILQSSRFFDPQSSTTTKAPKASTTSTTSRAPATPRTPTSPISTPTTSTSTTSRAPATPRTPTSPISTSTTSTSTTSRAPATPRTPTSVPISTEYENEAFSESSNFIQQPNGSESGSPVITDDLHSSYYKNDFHGTSEYEDSYSENIVIVTPPVTIPVETPRSTTTTSTTTSATVIINPDVDNIDYTFESEDIAPISPLDDITVHSPPTEDLKQFKECMGQDCMSLATVEPKVDRIVRLFEQKQPPSVRPRKDYSGLDVGRLVDGFENINHVHTDSKVISPTLSALRAGTLGYTEFPKRPEFQIHTFVPTREIVPKIAKRFEPPTSTKSVHLDGECLDTSAAETKKPAVSRKMVPKLVSAWEKLVVEEKPSPPVSRRTAYTFAHFCDDMCKKCSNASNKSRKILTTSTNSFRQRSQGTSEVSEGAGSENVGLS